MVKYVECLTRLRGLVSKFCYKNVKESTQTQAKNIFKENSNEEESQLENFLSSRTQK
jgi:hypothetical protein